MLPVYDNGLFVIKVNQLFFLQKMSFSNLWTLPINRVITVLSKDVGVEEKTNTFEGGGNPSERDDPIPPLYILIGTVIIIIFFRCFHAHLNFVDMSMVLSAY